LTEWLLELLQSIEVLFTVLEVDPNFKSMVDQALDFKRRHESEKAKGGNPSLFKGQEKRDPNPQA